MLLVDGQTFGWRGSQPYGGAIDAIGDGDGWHAIVGHNPLLAQQGVEHQRALLWRPGAMLITLDRVRSAERHRYTRHVHLGPAIGLESGAGSVTLAADGFAGELRDWSEEVVTTSTVRGREATSPGRVELPEPAAADPGLEGQLRKHRE